MSSTYIPSALRRFVCNRAKGCCEYCLISEATAFVPHEIDHVIAEKHGGLTEAENLPLSCTLCNKHKGIASSATKRAIALYLTLFEGKRLRFRVGGYNNSDRSQALLV